MSKEWEFEYLKGTGPGGQRKNKVLTACRVTHVPTGVTAFADERSQEHSKRLALKTAKERVKNLKKEQQAKEKKQDRDRKIQPGGTPIIRTYHYPRNTVKDHRTKKTLSIKDVLDKGRFVELQPRGDEDGAE